MKAFVLLFIRVLLGLAFTVSGAMKFTDIHAFANTISSLGVPPGIVSDTLAVFFPSLEIISGILLLIGLWTKVAAGAIIVLLSLFIAAIVPAVVNSENIDCGCFGPLAQSKIGVGLIMRDFIMLAMALISFTEKTHPYSLDQFIFYQRS